MTAPLRLAVLVALALPLPALAQSVDPEPRNDPPRCTLGPAGPEFPEGTMVFTCGPCRVKEVQP
jgi:hypothetical protein